MEAKGFEKVRLLPDGGVEFERRFFFRRVKASIGPDLEYTHYEAHFNVLNCVLAMLPSFLIGAIMVAVTGARMKENLLGDIQLIIQAKS